jgi:succinoglycan biosynthesis transport protein ExoP
MAKYDINIRDYLRIIRKRRTIVITAVVFCTVSSYLFALFASPEPRYQATSAVKVERVTDLTTLLYGRVSWTLWNNVTTQAVVITSFPIIERTAKEMGLIPEKTSLAEIRNTEKYLRIITSLQSRVQTEREAETNIINITASAKTPKEAALIANTVAKIYQQANVEERNQKVRETREFIEKQLKVVEASLQEAEQNLRTFEETTNLVAIDAQTATILNRLSSLETEVAQVQQKQGVVQRLLKALQEIRQGNHFAAKAFYIEDPPPELAKLIAKLRDLSLRHKILLNDYTQEHPIVEETNAELRDVLSEMDDELKSMLATLHERLRDLETRLATVRAETKSIPESSLILARLRREVDVNADLLTQLKSKYQEVMIQESGLIEEVKIIKPALESGQPVNMPSTLMNTVTGGIIGLVIGLVLALIVETMDTSLGTIEDVEEVLGVPVLGVIPAVDEFSTTEKGQDGVKLKNRPLVTHFAPRSPVSEAYRSLRTNLQFLWKDREAKVFLVTSSSLQEGKTYNVANLSLSLAQAGEKVLLIDADLRRPAAHNTFGLQRQPGLTDYIVGISGVKPPGEDEFELEMGSLPEFRSSDGSWKEVTNTVVDVMLGDFGFDDILRTPGMDNLHIINAGQGLLNPAEILRSPRFKEFLQEVRDHYDVIIVDTPPVLPVADAFEVAPEVDGVILVYEVGRIGRGILNRAKVQLENVNSNVLGVILNNVKPDVAPDFYRYRTDYYYEDKSDKGTSTPSSRWKDVINQGIGGLRSILSVVRPASATVGKGSKIVILTVLMGLTLIAGLLLYNFPGLSSPTHNKSHSQKGKIVVPPSAKKANTQLPRKSTKAAKKVTKPAAVLKFEPEVAPEKPVAMPEQPAANTAPIALHSSVAKKPSQVTEATSLQGSETQTWESLPHTAEIRLGPNIHSPAIQLIRSGTPLQVVGKQGDWLRLQLRNGNTGWIYHSFAQPRREPLEKPLAIGEKSNGNSEPLVEQPKVIKKSSSAGVVHTSMRRRAQSYTSLPEVARIRSGPTIHSPVLQLIRRGTRLEVVGKKRDWLKLQLRNGSTGWIYHSLAQPDREPVKKPLPVLKGSKETSEPFFVQPSMTKKAPSAEEVLPLMENGSEVALFYPE